MTRIKAYTVVSDSVLLTKIKDYTVVSDNIQYK